MIDPVPQWAREQFGQFYMETFDRVLARARMLTGGGAQRSAEDLMQGAYVQALRHWEPVLAGLADPQRLMWMRTTMSRLAAREHAQEQQFRACAALLYQPDFSEASGPDEAALAALTAQQCWRAIQAMPEIEKNVSILCFLDHYSRVQAAEILGLPEVRCAVP